MAKKIKAPEVDHHDMFLIAQAKNGKLRERGWKTLRERGHAVVIQGRNVLCLHASDAHRQHRSAKAYPTPPADKGVGDG